MKKQVKVIISIVVAIAILILGISFFFPDVFKGLTSGTFGKADKYQKQQMTEKDILLRSDLVNDTGQLRNMIQGLIYFSLFTQDLSKNIDSCVNSFKAKGMCITPAECASISALKDYAEFIRNNNKTLGITISMLTGFYLKDNSDQSADVEVNLRTFGTYVNNLTEKDSVLNTALMSMDKFMLSNKTMKNKKEELASLKSIRDQLLLQGVQLAGLLQDKPLCSQLLGYALSSQSSLNVIIFGTEKLNLYNQGGLNVFMSQDKLGNLINNNEMGFNSNAQLGDIIQSQELSQAIRSKEDLGSLVGSAVLYDKTNLQFIVGNKTELQKVISATQITAILQGADKLGSLAGVAVFSSQGLNLYQSNIDLKAGFTAQQNNLGLTMSSAQLNQVLSSQQGLGSLVYGSGFISLVGQIGSQQLGRSGEN